MDSSLLNTASNASSISIFYDGECPLCAAYVRHVRLKRNFSRLELVDARKDQEIARHFYQKGMSLDDGMVVRIADSEYYADDAIHVLALLSSSSGVFNRLNALIFRCAPISKALYPVMKMGRALLLKLLGRGSIDQQSGIER